MQKLLSLTLLCLFLNVQMAEGQIFGQRQPQRQQPPKQLQPQPDTDRSADTGGARVVVSPLPPEVSAGTLPVPVAPSIGIKSGPISTEGLTYTDGKTHVLLVGVNNYPMREPAVEGQEHLQSAFFSTLNYCAKDMVELKKALIDARFCNEEDVQLLISGVGGNLEPTGANVGSAFRALLDKIKKDDRVLVAFSGHGIALPSEERGKSEDFLACTDAKVIYNDIPLVKRFTTREGIVSRAELEKALDRSLAGPKLVFIDACRNVLEVETETASGDGNKGIKGLPKFGSRDALDGTVESRFGLFRFSSCLPSEISREHRELEHGVFTHFIIKGLQGEADSSNSGRVTLASLFEYVRKNTQTYVENMDIGTSQTPSLARLPHEGPTAATEIVLAYCAPKERNLDVVNRPAEVDNNELEELRRQVQWLIEEYNKINDLQRPGQEHVPNAGRPEPPVTNPAQEQGIPASAQNNAGADSTRQDLEQVIARLKQEIEDLQPHEPKPKPKPIPPPPPKPNRPPRST